MAEFGEQLKKAREELGMTQQSLADKVYVTRQTISRWESGARYPDVLTLKKLAAVLKVSTDYLLSDEELPAVVEKTPVIEKPIINNLMVVLYSLVAFLMIVLTIGEMGTPFIWDTIIHGGAYIVFQALKDLIEAVLFIYGLGLILFGVYTPKQIGIITVSYFVLETITNTRHLFVNQELWVLSILIILPYFCGALAAYLFYWNKNQGAAVRVLIIVSSAFGIFRQIASLVIMMLYSREFIDPLYIVLSMLRIFIYLTFIYQSLVLYMRRKKAMEITGGTFVKQKIGASAIVIGVILFGISLITKILQNRSVSVIGGADGPTAIFVAAKVGSPWVQGLVIGAVVIVVGIVLLVLKKKR